MFGNKYLRLFSGMDVNSFLSISKESMAKLLNEVGNNFFHRNGLNISINFLNEEESKPYFNEQMGMTPHAISDWEKKRLTFTNDFFTQNQPFIMLFIFFHELSHFLQYKKIEKGPYDEECLVLSREKFIEDNDEEYCLNVYNTALYNEVAASYNGSLLLEEFLSKYNIRLLDYIRESLLSLRKNYKAKAEYLYNNYPEDDVKAEIKKIYERLGDKKEEKLASIPMLLNSGKDPK
jgi:hypothetical protein